MLVARREASDLGRAAAASLSRQIVSYCSEPGNEDHRIEDRTVGVGIGRIDAGRARSLDQSLLVKAQSEALSRMTWLSPEHHAAERDQIVGRLQRVLVER